VSLSALYVDVLKDRLYCNATNDVARRAAQTAMHEICLGLARLLAPIIPFTADEAWGYLGQPGSVHTATFPEIERFKAAHEVSHADWSNFLDLRTRVNEALEAARREKKIGKSLEACVEIAMGHPEQITANISLPELEELFIVSRVVITRDAEAEAPFKEKMPDPVITVTRAEEHGMKKCVRCWKYWDRVGAIDQENHPELCDRCTRVVLDWKG
jgi:isoleucyl-tRNA synthetase